MWKIDQLIVCVDDKFQPHRKTFVPNLPQRGQIYSIRDILVRDDDGPAFHLHEIVNAPRHFRVKGEIQFCEAAFYAWRFRPLKSTDISIFTEILNTVDEDA
jgi:hypothetical protein